MSVMDRWFVPLLQQIDCEETKTKSVRRFVMSSLAQLSRLVDPGCHSAQVAGDDEEKTHALVCTTERPAILRYSDRCQTMTLKAWVTITDAQGLQVAGF